jgi:predicted CoA-binding protein
MKEPRSAENVAILGASPKPERYAYKAFELLQEYGHRPIPVNPAFDEVLGEKCYPKISDVPKPIDTITIYLGEARSNPLIGEIVNARPRRIIMNPGAENSALAAQAEEAGIEVVEGCTLVMLRTGQF